MLFRGDIEPCCAYCKHGNQISMDRVACLKRGIVSLWGSCRKFSYDPLKRQPERPRKLPPPEDVPADEVFHL